MNFVKGNLLELPAIKARTAVTIGNFDGVHRGHHKLISELTNEAQNRDLESLVLTFDPHPQSVIEGKRFLPLTTVEQKSSIFKSLGIDHFVIQDFSSEFSQLTAEDFLRQFLFPHFNPELILFGYDFRFGRFGKGDFSILKKYNEKSDRVLLSASPEKIKDEIISSSEIRNSLSRGDVDKANLLLNRRYKISGVVEKGDQIGRSIGFPTANFGDVKNYLPQNGVYYGLAYGQNLVQKAVFNIGQRPTLNKQNELRVECHLLDFSGDLYNQTMEFEFIGKIRDEKKFSSIDELKKQIAIDCDFGREKLRDI